MRSMIVLTIIGSLLLSSGCQSKAGTGALIGTGVGALAGGIIGNNTGKGHTAGGAAIGAGVGAISGALVGHAMDESDRKKEEARYTSDYDKNFDAQGRRIR
jgi:outer membrane lipoprotein SlyB